MPSLPTSSDRGPHSGGAWREDLLTRLGWVLFLAISPLAVYFANSHGWAPLLSAAVLVLPFSGAVTAVFAVQLGLRLRASAQIGALLASGAAVAYLGGPEPGAVLSLLVAAVLAALV